MSSYTSFPRPVQHPRASQRNSPNSKYSIEALASMDVMSLYELSMKAFVNKGNAIRSYPLPILDPNGIVANRLRREIAGKGVLFLQPFAGNEALPAAQRTNWALYTVDCVSHALHFKLENVEYDMALEAAVEWLDTASTTTTPAASASINTAAAKAPSPSAGVKKPSSNLRADAKEFCLPVKTLTDAPVNTPAAENANFKENVAVNVADEALPERGVLQPAPTHVIFPPPTAVLEPARTSVLEPAPTHVLLPPPTSVLEPARTSVLEPAPTHVLLPPTDVLEPSPNHVIFPPPTAVLEPARTSVLEPAPTHVLLSPPTSVLEPARTSVLEPAPTHVIFPPPTSVLEPARTSVLEPARTSVLEPARTSVLEPALSPFITPATPSPPATTTPASPSGVPAPTPTPSKTDTLFIKTLRIVGNVVATAAAVGVAASFLLKKR